MYGNKQMFCEAYPIKSKTEHDVGTSLKRFIVEYGAPEEMVTDGSKEQKGKCTVSGNTAAESDQSHGHEYLYTQAKHSGDCDSGIKEKVVQGGL